MPQIIHLTNKGVFISCEYIPLNDDAVKAAEIVSATFCRRLNTLTGQYEFRCGYCRDAAERGLELFCFHPTSPYLLELKKQLAKQK